jgi:hypothetical protein
MTWKHKRHYPMRVTAQAWYGTGFYGPLWPDEKEDTANPQVNADHIPLSDAQFGSDPAPVAGHVDAI